MAGAGACCRTQCTVPSGVARMTLRECNKTGDAVGCSLRNKNFQYLQH
jgi:hypothetical protein